tara:strand:+ start:1929 stop:2528 length:600 start_codon:yes stop_codon:yes gene_type:complete
MKHKIKVVTLPTEDRTSKIWFDNDTQKLLFDPLGVMNCNPLHLYITVSQDVIGGKEVYYIDKFTNKLTSSGGAEYGSKQDVVIATTDTKIHYKGEFNEKLGRKTFADVPQVQQSFLKEFVANPDGEWEVEYSWLQSCVDAPSGHIYELKLNQDNEVTITSVEEKMYGRREVLLLLHDLSRHLSPNNTTIDLTDWIKENL